MSSYMIRRALKATSQASAGAAGTHCLPYTSQSNGTADPLISRQIGSVAAPSRAAADRNPLRIAAGSCCSRENTAGATLLTGSENVFTGQYARLAASA